MKNWRVRNNKQMKVQVMFIQRKKSNNYDSKKLTQGKKPKKSFETLQKKCIWNLF
jgi:hypothetical protein